MKIYELKRWNWKHSTPLIWEIHDFWQNLGKKSAKRATTTVQLQFPYSFSTAVLLFSFYWLFDFLPAVVGGTFVERKLKGYSADY